MHILFKVDLKYVYCFWCYPVWRSIFVASTSYCAILCTLDWCPNTSANEKRSFRYECMYNRLYVLYDMSWNVAFMSQDPLNRHSLEDIMIAQEC